MSDEQCPECGRTDTQYRSAIKRGRIVCRNPWHADDHLRDLRVERPTVTLSQSHAGKGVCPACGKNFAIAQEGHITDAMVSRALDAWFASPPSETDQGLERSMRAALEAAHNTTKDEVISSPTHCAFCDLGIQLFHDGNRAPFHFDNDGRRWGCTAHSS